MEENQTTTVMQDITGPPPPPATSPPFDALQKPAQLVNDSPVGPLDAPFETVEPLADPGDRRAKTWARARVALIIGAVVAFVGVGAYALIQRAGRTSPSQASNFNTVSLPLTGLGSAGLAATGAGSLTVNGVLRVTDSLVLTPIAQPTNPQTGQIFFDKLTSQLAYYNGQDFVNVAGVTTNNTSNTTNVTNVTNVLSGAGAGVQLQQTSPGVQQAGNLNISGTGLVGTLKTTVIDSGGGTLYVNPVSATSQQTVVPGTPQTVGLTSASIAAPGPGWANDLSATKVTLGSVGGTAVSISVFFSGGSSANHVQVGLFDDDGDVPSKPSSLLASSAVVNLVPNGLTTITIPAVNLNANNTYWLGVNTDDNSVGRTYNGGSKASCFRSSSFGFMPDPFGGCFYDDNMYSIALNYSAGSGVGGSLSQAAIAVGPTGQVLLQNATDSTTAFRVQNALGNSTLIDVDTINGRVGIGKSSPTFKLDVAAGDINVGNSHSYRFGGLQALSANSDGSIVSLTNFNSGGSLSAQAANFLIQDANATTVLFKADAANLRINIGDGTPSNTPVLLFLANKNTAGDPVGGDGATYYNSTLASFRCYYNGAWHNCADIEPQHSFSLYDEFMGGGTSFAGPIGSLGWSAAAIGANGSLALNPATPTPAADRPGVLALTTPAVANQGTTLLLGSTGPSVIMAAGNDLKTAVAPSAAAGEVLRIGLHTETTATTQPLSGVWWEADPGSSPNWRYCYGDGATATCAATAVAIAANTWATLEIRLTATGAGTSAASFVINNTPFTVSAVTIDSTNRVSPALSCYATGAAARSCYWDYFQLTGTTSAAR